MNRFNKNSNIRVLNVLTCIEDGGMETLVFRIYKALTVYEIFDLYVCSLTAVKDNFLIREFEKNGIKIINLNFKNKNLTISDYFKNVLELFKLANVIRINKINVVNAHDFFSGTITRLASAVYFVASFFKPIKIYVTLHNLFFWLKPVQHFINKILSTFTSRIICVSKSVYEYSLKHDKINDSKYKIIYNGIDEKEFTPDPDLNVKYRKMIGFSENDLIIGNIGTFSVRKGQKYLLNAFSELCKKDPNLRLVIFGSYRNHEIDILDEIKQIINTKGLKNSVKILDTRDDIKYLYNIFDIFVMPSISEGFSLAAIEAMLMKRICLFSDIGPFKELVEDGVNGFLFRSKNTESLLEKLSYVLNNLSSLMKIGVAARESVLKRFSFETMVRSYYELYTVKYPDLSKIK